MAMGPRVFRLLFIAVLGLALLRYVAVARFVHPFADDFSYAAIGMRTELLPRLHDEYVNWNGRWFSNALVLRGPLVLGLERGLWLYRAVPIALLLLLGLSTLRLIGLVAPGLARRDRVLGAALFLLTALQLLPDLSEGVYWYTGAVTYLLPAALFPLLLAEHARAWQSGWRWSAGGAARAALLSAIAIGCNETHLVLVALLNGGVATLALRRCPRAWRAMLPLLIVTAIAAAAVVLAPGNAGRAAHFPLRHDPLRTIGWGALQSGRFLLQWLGSPVLLTASLIFLAALRGWRPAAPLLRDARLPRPLPVAMALGAVLFLCMALPYWATGLLGQHRTVNAALLALLPGWFLLLAAMHEHNTASRPWPALAVGLQRLAWALFLIACLFTGSGGRVTGDLLSGRLNRFDAQLQDRYATIRKAAMAGSGTVVLPPLADAPHALRYLDATDDPEHWINRSMMNWLGADEARLRVLAPG